MPMFILNTSLLKYFLNFRMECDWLEIEGGQITAAAVPGAFTDNARYSTALHHQAVYNPMGLPTSVISFSKIIQMMEILKGFSARID